MSSFINFFDGYTSASTPIANQADTTFVVSYIDDSAFETANGAPPYTDKTGFYYNTTTNTLRYYDQNTTTWKDVGTGGEIVLKQEDLGFGNGVLTNYPLGFAPVNAESCQVFLDGLIYEKSNYSIISSTVVFNVAPDSTTQIYVSYLTAGVQTATVVNLANSYIVNNRTISAGEESAKQLTLTATPTNVNEVIVQVVDGVNLRNGTDYIITGNVMDWDGYGLDGIIASGDELTIWFFT